VKASEMESAALFVVAAALGNGAGIIGAAGLWEMGEGV
jgi:uridine phosphorylase